MPEIMKAEVKHLFCVDKPDLENWVPFSPVEVYVNLNIDIGPVGTDAANHFQVLVATREGLQRYVGDAYRNPDPRCMMIHKYDWKLIEEGSVNFLQLIETRIQNIVAQCDGWDWEEIAEKLSRHFHWEFEDYTG